MLCNMFDRGSDLRFDVNLRTVASVAVPGLLAQDPTCPAAAAALLCAKSAFIHIFAALLRRARQVNRTRRVS